MVWGGVDGEGRRGGNSHFLLLLLPSFVRWFSSTSRRLVDLLFSLQANFLRLLSRTALSLLPRSIDPTLPVCPQHLSTSSLHSPSDHLFFPPPPPADISANLKQAVSKAAAQKALLSLSDKGLLTKKDYGRFLSTRLAFSNSLALHLRRPLFPRQTNRLRLSPGKYHLCCEVLIVL